MAQKHAELLALDTDGMLSIVGDMVAVRIIVELSTEGKRFSDFKLGVSSKTLSKKLKLLEQNRVITRSAFPEIPPRVEYDLTVKGQELVSIIDGLLQWEQSWLQPGLKPSQRL